MDRQPDIEPDPFAITPGRDEEGSIGFRFPTTWVEIVLALICAFCAGTALGLFLFGF